MIDLGDTYTTSIEVYTAPPDQGGTLVNPSTAVLTITAPDGTTTTPGVTNTSVGKYKYDLVATQAGTHSLRWLTTSPATALTDVVDVRPTAPAYLFSLAEAKAQVNIAASDTTYDEDLRTYIEGTTAIIESYLGKIVVRRSVSEILSTYVYGSGYPCVKIALRHIPVISLTSLGDIYGSYTYDVSLLQVDGPTGIVTALSAPSYVSPLVFHGDLKAVYMAGYSVVPASYTLAAKMILQENWDTQRQPGIGPAALFGTPDPSNGSGFVIPPRAVALLGPRAPVLA